jgi:YedE family putative selenium metabolism protein
MDRAKWGILASGLLIGVIAVLLVKQGNPPNMGFCIACFQRDIAGAIGLHRAGIVQYMRPEIIGLLLGGFLTSLAFGEFKSQGGSSTLLRFFMGFFMMVGALVFLGCPLRDILRMSGGDFNAVVGFAGFVAGVGCGVYFLKRGFNLGRSETSHSSLAGYILPAIMVLFLVFLLRGTVFNPEAGGPLFFSKEGPGSMHAPILISLAAGLAVGFIAQRVRLCLSGGIRDFILIKDTYLLLGFLGIFIGALVMNIAFGFFNPGFENQPVAHSAHIWNFLGLFLVGLTAVLLGGCPLRQLILSSQGDTDAAAVVVGMIVGAGVIHNFMMAGSAAGVGVNGQIACLVGIVFMLIIGLSFKEA